MTHPPTPLTRLADVVDPADAPHVAELERRLTGSRLRALVAEGYLLSHLAELVTETGNPGNIRGVTSATVRLDAPRLLDSVELVDTPGVRSVYEQNADTAGHALSQMDTALFVVRAALPQTLRRHGNSDRHRSVWTRAHRLAAAIGEREQAALAALTRTEQEMDLQHEPAAARHVDDAALSVAAEQILRIVDGLRTRRARELDGALQGLAREAGGQVDRHVAAVRAMAAELFDLDLELAQVPRELGRSVRFRYAFGNDPGQPQALTGAVRRSLPGSLGRRRTQRYVRRRTVELLAQQTGRARADLDQRLRKTRRMLLKGRELRFDGGAGRLAAVLRRGERLRRIAVADLDAARHISRRRGALATGQAADLAAYDPVEDEAA